MKIQIIRQRREYYLSVLMFKAIHGLAPHYLCNDVIMIVDVHGYDTKISEIMNIYMCVCVVRSTPKKYANANDVISHIKELCYGMTSPMR